MLAACRAFSGRKALPSRSFRAAAGLRDGQASGLSSGPNPLPLAPGSKDAEGEMHDVFTIDRLLNNIRSRSNPAYCSIMPMRSKKPWSETLLDSARNASAQAQSPPTSSSPPFDASTNRRMHDSYTQIDLPFASQPKLLEQYVNAWGGIRIGKLMEHLDSLAGSIAYKHMLGPEAMTVGKIQERGYYIVTAAVDRLDMLGSLYPVRDVQLCGHVIYTGKSSMEIAVKMEALEEGGFERTLMLGRFSMVCRDARTHKAYPVNPIVTSNDDELSLHRIGEGLKKRKMVSTERSLARVPPSYEEARALHDLYLQSLNSGGKGFGDGKEKMRIDDTTLEKTLLMFPQERNVHQKIFGGYLMRLAYELGFTAASVFTGMRHLRFFSLDGIWFERPVEIGSVLRLTARVTHAREEQDDTVVHVFVQAQTVDVKTGLEEHTNDFKFTWGESHDSLASSQPSEPLHKLVVPETYAESMAWVEGRRALEYGAKIRGLRKP